MAGWPTKTRAAQLQELDAAARAQEQAHEALRDLPFGVMIHAVLAHIQARPDATADEVSALGKALNAMAWEMERNNE
jgi:HAMP domain-containing protein